MGLSNTTTGILTKLFNNTLISGTDLSVDVTVTKRTKTDYNTTGRKSDETLDPQATKGIESKATFREIQSGWVTDDQKVFEIQPTADINPLDKDDTLTIDSVIYSIKKIKVNRLENVIQTYRVAINRA